MTKWSQQEAIELCAAIEKLAPQYGCHVALTGGCLYKGGPRKDADILFYRIRQVETIDVDGLFDALEKAGIEITGDFGWCVKAKIGERNIDFFFPEREGGEYPQSEDQDDTLEQLF